MKFVKNKKKSVLQPGWNGLNTLDASQYGVYCALWQIYKVDFADPTLEYRVQRIQRWIQRILNCRRPLLRMGRAYGSIKEDACSQENTVSENTEFREYRVQIIQRWIQRIQYPRIQSSASCQSGGCSSWRSAAPWRGRRRWRSGWAGSRGWPTRAPTSRCWSRGCSSACTLRTRPARTARGETRRKEMVNCCSRGNVS